MEWLIIVLYGLALCLICLFSLGQLNLTWHYLKAKRKQASQAATLEDFPLVTVQLPVYNERYVVARLIDAVCGLDYPKDKVDIQILDDSDDETVEIIQERVASYAEKGYHIKQVRRPDRTGYKAGALHYGMVSAQGDYIAIFDADFVPPADFLLKTLPMFDAQEIGMVQTKWAHLNKNYSWLTKIQAFWLDAHFTVEQKGREQAGSFLNFNGTAGIWRKDCIEDAGGWEHDTLTEDLDLSYRAQLKGWRFVYSEEVESPAELPVAIPAIKSQQYRWNKGAAETARKTLGNVLRSKTAFKHKVRATFHLLNSSVFLLLLITGLLSVPMLYIKAYRPELQLFFHLLSLFLVGFFAMIGFYWVAAKSTHPSHTMPYFVRNFPMFLAFSMGMALHNSIAVVEGYLGIKTPFIRTPKFNVKDKGDIWKGNAYIKNALTPVIFFEGVLALYFGYGVWSAFKLGDFGLVLFHFMMAFGCAYIFILSIRPIKYA